MNGMSICTPHVQGTERQRTWPKAPRPICPKTCGDKSLITVPICKRLSLTLKSLKSIAGFAGYSGRKTPSRCGNGQPVFDPELSRESVCSLLERKLVAFVSLAVMDNDRYFFCWAISVLVRLPMTVCCTAAFRRVSTRALECCLDMWIKSGEGLLRDRVAHVKHSHIVTWAVSYIWPLLFSSANSRRLRTSRPLNHVIKSRAFIAEKMAVVGGRESPSDEEADSAERSLVRG